MLFLCWFFKGVLLPKIHKSNMNVMPNNFRIQKSILFPWDSFSGEQQC